MKSSGKRRPEAPSTPVAGASVAGATRPEDARVRRHRGLGRPRAHPRALQGSLDHALVAAADAVTLFDRDWRILFINQRSADMLGASRSDLLGRNLWEMYPGGASGRAYEEFMRAMRDQVSVVFEQLSPNAGRMLQCHALPTPEGLLLISRDVSDSGATLATPATAPLVPSARPNVVDMLQRSERRFRALIENSSDAVLMIDARGRVAYSSPRAFGPGGLLPGKALGPELLAHLHPDDVARAREDGARLLAEPGGMVTACYRIRHRSERWTWLEGVAHNRLSDPAVRAIVVNARDVTERKAAEQKMATLLEVARDLSSTLDAGELLVRVGRRVAVALGCEVVSTYQWDEGSERYLPTSLFGLPPDGVAELADLPLAAGAALSARIEHGPVVFENADAGDDLRASISRRLGVKSFVAAPLRSLTRHHGALIAATTSAERHFDPAQAEMLAAIATQLAIALERADLHRCHQQDAQLYGALARVGQELLAGFDLPDLPERFCRVTAEVLGCSTAHTVSWPGDDADGNVVATCGADLDATEALRVVRIPRSAIAALLARSGAHRVLRLVAGDESPAAELASILAIPAGAPLLVIPLRRGDEIVGLHTTARDEPGSDFGDAELAIAGGLARLGSLVLEHARAMEELGRANRLKADFVASMSHELRTPLNAVLGYSDLLLDDTFGTLQPAQAEVVRGIHASGHSLLQLIRDVLDLSRLDSGRNPLDMQSASVPGLMAELAAGAQSLQRDGEVELVVAVDPGLGTLVTDPAKLMVALKNLLANAFKFTARGRVTLAARVENGGVVFAVEDTGIGIPAEHLDIIFEPFRQGDGALTRRHGGVGLGLYVVRRMLEMLGGRIDVDSRIGHGSTFRIWLPAAGCATSRGGSRGAGDQLPSSDAVTGLPSSALLRDRLAHALRGADSQQIAAGLLFIELDCASALAHGLAPRNMDALLCMVAERLISVLRMTDTVAHPGGHDFLVLLTGRTTEDAIQNLARALRATLAVEFLVDGVAYRIGATIGAVVARGGNGDPDAIVTRARGVALQAKSTGDAIAISTHG